MIFPDGHVDTPDEQGNRVLTPGQAYTVTDILKDVITSGTGAGYTYMGCSSEAGKTGTSELESDAWFVGYTPLYSTAVWVGHPNSRDYTGFGGPTAGPIWRQYMEAAQGNGSNCPDFPVPSSLPSLSSFTSSLTSSAPTKSTYPTTTTGTTRSGATRSGAGGGTGTSHFDPNLYQGGDNGIQTQPTPAPPPTTGGTPGGGVNPGGN